MIRSLLLSLYLFIIIPCVATNYYVATTGNNANAGTSIGAPWKTIQFALNQVNAGDVVQVLAGTYTGKLTWSNSGTAGNYITLKNYNTDVVILDGSTIGNNQALLYIENKNYIKIQGLHFTNHNGSYQPIINAYGNNSHIEITDCEFYNTDCNESYAILCEGRGDDYKILNNNMHDLLGSNAVGVLFVGSHISTPFSNILISGNHITNIAPAPSEAIAVNGNIDGFEISNNYLETINNIGIVMIGGEDWVNTNDAVNFARNGVCKWNTVIHANSIYGGGYAGGVYVDGGKNIIVENNTITGSDVGLEIGCENHGFIAENITVRNNIIYKNEKAGLGFGGYDFPATGMVQNCSFTGNTVFDNDLYNVGFGQLWVQYALNCTVENNIFYTSTNAWMVNAETTNASFGNHYNYNDFYYPAGITNARFFFDFDYIVGFDNFRTATGEDAQSFFTNPLFVDVFSPTPNLHLQSTSPCLNAGNPNYGLLGIDFDDVDMDGAARLIGSAIDMGSDEISLLPLSYNTVVTNATCNGSCNASLNISGVNGCSPYTIEYKPVGVGWITYTGTLTGLCAGNYKIKITDACASVVTATININQDPILNITVSSIVNETVAGASNGKIIVNSSGGFGARQFSINGGITWQSSKKFTGLSSGIYNIMVSDSHLCSNSIAATVGIGMRMGDLSVFDAYPNPASNELKINFDTEQTEDATISLYNIAGACVLSQNILAGDDAAILHFNLPSGIYVLEYLCTNSRQIKQLIIE